MELDAAIQRGQGRRLSCGPDRPVTKSRFSEEQIIGILKEHQAGIGAKELCRKHGISDGTFYIYGRLSPCKRFKVVSDQ